MDRRSEVGMLAVHLGTMCGVGVSILGFSVVEVLVFRLARYVCGLYGKLLCTLCLCYIRIYGCDEVLSVLMPRSSWSLDVSFWSGWFLGGAFLRVPFLINVR